MLWRQIGPALVVLLAGSGIGACGDGGGVGADDPLVQAIVDQALAETAGDQGGGLFGGERANAECFAVEVVDSIGTDRLTELGVTVESIPVEFRADWNADEIDTIIGAFDGCLDIAAVTRTGLFAGVSEQDQDCIVDEIGDDFLLDTLRAGLESGTDEAASDAALEEVFAPLFAAYETCDVALFGDAAGQPGDLSEGDDGFEVPDPASLPEADAPFRLGEVALPDDTDGITGLFDDLPEELLGSQRSIDTASPDRLMASYGFTQPVGCGTIGLQAMDVSRGGGTAEQMVAIFASGADWDVEASGRDGDLFWVTWRTTCSNASESASDTVFSATWANAGSPWAFSALAGAETERDQLLAAFASAAG